MRWNVKHKKVGYFSVYNQISLCVKWLRNHLWLIVLKEPKHRSQDLDWSEWVGLSPNWPRLWHGSRSLSRYISVIYSVQGAGCLAVCPLHKDSLFKNNTMVTNAKMSLHTKDQVRFSLWFNAQSCLTKSGHITDHFPCLMTTMAHAWRHMMTTLYKPCLLNTQIKSKFWLITCRL